MSISTGVTGILCTLSIEGSALAESQEFSLSCDRTTVDLTNRDSSYWRQLVISTKSWTVSGSGLYIYSDLAKKYLVEQYENDTPATLSSILTLADGAVTATGEAILSSLVFPAPHDGAATITFTLEGTDSLSFSAS